MIDLSAVMDPAPGSPLAAFLTLSAVLAAVLSNESKSDSLLAALQKVRIP